MKRFFYLLLIIPMTAVLFYSVSVGSAAPMPQASTPTERTFPFLLAEAHLRYAKTVDPFDVQSFLDSQNSPLADTLATGEVGGATIAEVIARESTMNGINPRVLLTLMQIRSGAIMGSPLEPGEPRPLIDQLTQTLPVLGTAAEIGWAASTLNASLESAIYGTAPLSVTMTDGAVQDLRALTNPSSYAVYELASQWGIPDWYSRLTDPRTGFVATYKQWFGDPLTQPTFLPAIAPEVSANWLLPYESAVVRYEGGPHAYGYELDPPTSSAKCVPMLIPDAAGLDFALSENARVLAIDSGWVRHMQWYSGPAGWVVVVEHDSGAVPVASYYMHMSDRNPALHAGMRISRGTWLGNEGTGNGQWGSHLHLEIRQSGSGDWWTGANHGVPVSWEGLQIDGWAVGIHQVPGTSKGFAYQGSVVQGNSTRKLLKTTEIPCSGRPLANMLVSTGYPANEDDENNVRDSRTVFAGQDPEGKRQTLRSHNIEPDPIDVALILDSSGSMGGNDPQDLRKAAAKLFIGAMEENDQVAVVDFDDSVRVPWPLQRVGSDRQQPLAAVDTIDSYGWTNILAALQTGFNQLKLSTASNPKAAVFLTDGYDTENNSDASILNVADSYAAKGWRIFTIGLIGPEGVDEDLLRQIAARTGGQYSRLTSADQLVDVYFKLLGHATGGTTISDQTTILRPGQTQTIAVTMPGDQTTANFLTTWPGSTVDMTLIDPTGRVITPGITDQDPAIDHQKGLTYELYRVTAPQAGAWRVSIYGADLPAGGENVRVQVAVRAPRGGKAYLPLVLSRYGGGVPITPTATPTATASRTRTPTPTATPTVTPTAMPSTGIVEGKAFYDANGNGSMDAGEVGLAGAVLVLEQGGAEVYTATSDLTGQYSFPAVAPSQYQLREKTPPPGYLHNASFRLSFFVNANQTLSGDFFNVGHQQAPTPTPTFTPAVGSLVNGGFEAGSTLPTGWTNDAWTSGRTTFTWDNAQARSGSRSIKIVSNEENDARWVQTVAVQPQTDYRLSGCIKTENVPHRADGTDAGANLSLMGGWIRSPGVFGTTGWTCTSLTFNSGGDTQVIVAARLGFYAGTTTGAAWFDDLQLEKLGTPTPTSSPTPTETPTPYPQSISIQIFADNQDGMEDTLFSISGDSAHHNWVGVSPSVMTGWVFPMVYIPRGATITHAYIRTYGFGIAGNATTRIYGFAQDFAPVFAADGSNRPSTRPTTAAYVDWPKTWTFAWQWIETPNFANVVQEIVNRPGWVSGNTLGIRANIPSGTGTNWCSVDYAAGSGPTTLYISYLAP